MHRVLKYYLLCLGILLAWAALAPPAAFAASNIDPTEPNHWAWNDVVGWIDFCVSSGGPSPTCALNVEVTSTKLTKYASSTVGYIALNCDSTPNGNICSGPLPASCVDQGNQWRVCNDGSGNLSGWAWNDVIGWISFWCGDLVPNCNNNLTNYRVTIDASGYFHGWAWNDVIGWISFNCDNLGTCAAVDYKVKTGWMPGPAGVVSGGHLLSSAFDTCPAATPQNTHCGSASYHSIMWQGDPLPAGAKVEFQIATSNCANGAVNPPTCNSGSWSDSATCNPSSNSNSCFVGWNGTSLRGETYNLISPDRPEPIGQATIHNNKRYVRYKIFLARGTTAPSSPVVRDVIITWSP